MANNYVSVRFLLPLLVFASFSSSAQSPAFLWAGKLGGVNSSTPTNLATDFSGNVITVGYLGLPATSDFDPGPGVYYIPTPGSQNNYISKLDANGAFVWATAIGGQGMNDIKGITTDSVGNIYLTGSFSGTADFDPGSATFNVNSNNSSTDVFVAKLDANANLIWVKAVGGIGTDQGRSVAVDLEGNVYVTGKFSGTTDFDPGSGMFSLFGYNEDAFVLKLAANGDFIWAKDLGGNQYDEGCDIVADDSSNTYVTGQFSDFGIFGNYSMASLGGRDVFIAKLDSSGGVLWAKQIGASVDSPRVFSMALDKTGSVIIAGRYFNKIDINPNAGVSFITSQPYICGEYFLLKLTSSGGFVWGGAYARPALTCEANIDIATDTAGNVYATGLFSSGSDFNPGSGSYVLTTKGYISGGDYDIFVSRVNANGTFGWARGLGSKQRGDKGVAISLDTSGNIYTTGVFTDTVDMNPGANNYFLYVPDSNAGNPDYAIYVHKAGQCTTITSIVSQSACNSYTIAGTTYTKSGTYTVLLATANDCDSVVTLHLTVDPDTGVTRTSYTLKSNAAGAAYQWLDCNNNMSAIPGATNQVFQLPFNTTGSFAVALNKNGCVDTSACYFVSTVGIDQVNEKPVLKYYPNPVQDHVVIELDKTYHEVRIELYNVAGQAIQKTVFKDSKTIRNSFDIPPGVYLMSIQADGIEKQWIKLVK